MTAVATAPQPSVSLALTVPREEAARMIKGQIEHGAAIRRHRVRYVEDLEEVRARKAEWVQAYSDLLRQLFTTAAVADECNDWVGKVYPEYADMTLFVEQFYQEMDHRIRRLRTAVKRLPTIAEPVRVIPRVEAPAGAGGDAAPSDPSASPLPAGGEGDGAGLTSAAKPPPEPVVIEPPARGLLVVHPGAAEAAEAVARFLSELGVSLAVVSDVQQGSGAVEAFEQEPDASFAVLLLRPEEIPAPATEGAAPPRPEVLFQLGYFVGRLGLKRVCVLCPGGETCRDGWGVSHLPLDRAGGWQLHLARHLRRAGVEVDLNRLG